MYEMDETEIAHRKQPVTVGMGLKAAVTPLSGHMELIDNNDA